MVKLNICGRTAGYTCIAIGAFLAIFGVVFIAKFDTIFKYILGGKVVLTPSSNGYPIWKDVSEHLETSASYYFFNVTNPAEVITGGIPNLTEMGPYFYDAVAYKDNITFNANNTVSFLEYKSMYFNREKSVGDDTDMVTILNVPLMAALTKMKDASYFSRSMAGIAFSTIGVEMFVTKSIRELTYEGYADPLVALSSAKSDGIIAALGRLAKSDEPGAQGGRFGFAIGKNGTKPGVFTMWTGKTGVNDLNRVYSMNHQTKLDVWPKDECNEIRGTFGYLRPPKSNDSVQRIFVPDMCRSILIKYEKDVENYNLGLKRFIIPPESLENGKVNPENECYSHTFDLPSGVGELGPCKAGAPIVMSLPHFLYADPSFREGVHGMKPNESIHQFYMDTEPTTGMTVAVRGRMQINVRVQPINLADAGSLPTTVLPIFWSETRVEAGKGVQAFLHKVLGYPGIAQIVCIVVIIVAIIVMLIGMMCVFRNTFHADSHSLTPGKVLYSKAPTSEGGDHTNGNKGAALA